MSDASSQTTYFHNRHPISYDFILAKLRASRGHIGGLHPEDLFAHDQDHYGGTAATDELARGAKIRNGSRVADFCAGLAGTVHTPWGAGSTIIIFRDFDLYPENNDGVAGLITQQSQRGLDGY
jgi:hypothetical protein